MRLLQVIDSLGSGGKERQFIELLKGLSRVPNVECRAIVMSDLVQYNDFQSLNIRTDTILRRSRFDPSVFFRIDELVKEFDPDIIHSWNAMCSVYIAPVAKLRGVKFVNGYVRDAVPSSGLFDLRRLRGRLTIPFSDVVVSNSRAGLAAYRVPTAKGVCVFNGFDQSRLSNIPNVQEVRDSLGITTPFVVGMVGAFERHKDYESFFSMALDITKERDDITFLAVGGGRGLASFEARFPAEQNPRIKLLGRRGDIEGIVSIFSVGVLMSRGEGIANAIMEYMALGKPVVATRFGGNSEIVEEGRTGYLVDDVDGLTKGVLALIENRAQAAAFGERGRDRIKTLFSLEGMTQAYLDIYERLTSNKF
jgi:glycosyltransferase involved in cell wall biosynthesis